MRMSKHGHVVLITEEYSFICTLYTILTQDNPLRTIYLYTIFYSMDFTSNKICGAILFETNRAPLTVKKGINHRV